MNSHDLARGRGNFLDVLESMRQPAMVVSVSSDILYPPHEQELLARHMPNAQHKVLESDFGHDGFLIQSSELASLIREFRSGLRARRAA